MKTKYYQIVETTSNSDYPNVGVIKVTDNIYPLEEMKEAISNYLGVDLTIISVISDEHGLRIDFKLDGGYKDYMRAEETWLYL